MRLSEIITDLKIEVVRDGSFASLGFITHPRAEMLVFVESPRFASELVNSPGVSCVITSRDLVRFVDESLGVAIVDDPRRSFYQLHNHLASKTSFYGKRFPSRVAASARIHETAFVSPTDVVISDEVEIGPRAVILAGVEVGDGSIIRAGTIVGSEGYQVLQRNGEVFRVVHAGRVRVGRHVDIHSNTCVDRSVFGETVIGDETSIDNLVHVAHDVQIGTHCRIVALAMLGGSCRIGDRAWIGPSAVISSEVVVGSDAYVTLGAVVTQHVAQGTRVTGNFAISHERFLEFLRSIR